MATRLRDNRRQQEQIAQRLRTLDVLDRAVHAAEPAQPGTALWRWSRPEGNLAPLRLAAAGPMPELRVESRSVVSRDLTERLLLAALLGGAIGLLMWPRLRPQIAVWAWRGRYLWVSLAGLLAWFVLSPGLWGLMLAVLATAAVWRMGERNPGKRKAGERGA